MKLRAHLALSLGALFAVVLPIGVATAHPDHPDHGGVNQISYEEDFPGEGVEQDKQHDGEGGHLPAVQRNVRLVGRAEVINPSGGGNDGYIADVAAYGNYAYLNAFRDPDCAMTGTHVVDISDPANPVFLPGSFMPTTPGNYAGEGVKVIRIGARDVLIAQNETCPSATPAQSGGINLWDVTNPLSPQLIALHQGDFTNDEGGLDPRPNDSHSFDAWTNQFTGRSYAALIDNAETTDVDILDITDPAHPVLINDTLDLIEETEQETPDNLTSIFSHDMDVQRFGSRYVMTLNYWDGGYVLLDVTNPTAVQLMAQTDYAQVDEEQAARGRIISPEGNAHQSELDPRGRFMIGTDEDFNPYRVEATITDGPNAGTEWIGAQASDTPPLTEENTPLTGAPTFVGNACAPLAPASGEGAIALAERGVCSFQIKLDNITNAGYAAGIVFNSVRSDCLSLVTMLAEGDIPFVFVNRAVGLQILNQTVDQNTVCTTASPPAGSDTATLNIVSTFDGWGYVRLFGTKFPSGGGHAAQVQQLDTYAVPESQDPQYALDFGDLSVHEVAMDPRAGSNLAYISYYSAGFRVVEYGNRGITEVGAFIDDGGSNFWGVEVHQLGNRQYVLASDRDYGLYIFQYTG